MDKQQMPLKIDSRLQKMEKEVNLEDARRTLFALLEKTDFSDSSPDFKEKSFTVVFHICEILKKE